MSQRKSEFRKHGNQTTSAGTFLKRKGIFDDPLITRTPAGKDVKLSALLREYAKGKK